MTRSPQHPPRFRHPNRKFPKRADTEKLRICFAKFEMGHPVPQLSRSCPANFPGQCLCGGLKHCLILNTILSRILLNSTILKNHKVPKTMIWSFSIEPLVRTSQTPSFCRAKWGWIIYQLSRSQSTTSWGKTINNLLTLGDGYRCCRVDILAMKS